MQVEVVPNLGCAPPCPRETDASYGTYELRTNQAIKVFQSRNNLYMDGIAGKQTLHKMDEQLVRLGR